MIVIQCQHHRFTERLAAATNAGTVSVDLHLTEEEVLVTLRCGVIVHLTVHHGSKLLNKSVLFLRGERLGKILPPLRNRLHVLVPHPASERIGCQLRRLNRLQRLRIMLPVTP